MPYIWWLQTVLNVSLKKTWTVTMGDTNHSLIPLIHALIGPKDSSSYTISATAEAKYVML